LQYIFCETNGPARQADRRGKRTVSLFETER